jgi:hypothetical protein
MAETSTIKKVYSEGNGSSFVHAFSFEVYSADELLVMYIDATGAPTILEEGTTATTYSITFTTPIADGPSAGSITYPADESTAIASGTFILFVRVPDLLQAATFSKIGKNLPANTETALDKLCHKIQYLQEQIERCATVARQFDPNVVVPILPQPEAGHTWRWDEDALALEAVDISGDVVVAADNYTDLGDTPSSLTAEQLQAVAAAEDEVEEVAPFATLQAAREILVAEEHTANTSSGNGAIPGTGWQTRVLTRLAYNTITGASLGSNQITLPAGTYKLRAWTTAYRVDSFHSRFRNITDSTTVLSGIGHFTDDNTAVGGVTNDADIDAVFTIADTKVFEMQAYYGVSGDTFSTGVGTGGGEENIYTSVFLERLA